MTRHEGRGPSEPTGGPPKSVSMTGREGTPAIPRRIIPQAVGADVWDGNGGHGVENLPDDIDFTPDSMATSFIAATRIAGESLPLRSSLYDLILTAQNRDDLPDPAHMQPLYERRVAGVPVPLDPQDLEEAWNQFATVTEDIKADPRPVEERNAGADAQMVNLVFAISAEDVARGNTDQTSDSLLKTFVMDRKDTGSYQLNIVLGELREQIYFGLRGNHGEQTKQDLLAAMYPSYADWTDAHPEGSFFPDWTDVEVTGEDFNEALERAAYVTRTFERMTEADDELAAREWQRLEREETNIGVYLGLGHYLNNRRESEEPASEPPHTEEEIADAKNKLALALQEGMRLSRGSLQAEAAINRAFIPTISSDEAGEMFPTDESLAEFSPNVGLVDDMQYHLGKVRVADMEYLIERTDGHGRDLREVLLSVMEQDIRIVSQMPVPTGDEPDEPAGERSEPLSLFRDYIVARTADTPSDVFNGFLDELHRELVDVLKRPNGDVEKRLLENGLVDLEREWRARELDDVFYPKDWLKDPEAEDATDTHAPPDRRQRLASLAHPAGRGPDLRNEAFEEALGEIIGPEEPSEEGNVTSIKDWQRKNGK